MSTAAGLHRFVWDLHYPPPAASRSAYPISAIDRNTWQEPRGPWVLPGTYTVRLTVEGHIAEQPLVVKMDPRVKTPAAGLERQFALSMQMCEDMAKARAALAATPQQAPGGAGTGATSEAARLQIERVSGSIEAIYGMLQEADLTPTAQIAAAAANAHATLAKLLGPSR